MRILWIHQYFATPAGWGSVRTYEFARRWIAAGHTVDVLCCAAYDDSLVGTRLQTFDGVRVHVSATRYQPQMGFLRRLTAFASFMLFSLWHVLRHGRSYDLLIASSGPLTTLVPALAGRWLLGLPFAFEVIDVWPDSAIAAGVLRSPVLIWLARRLEAAGYRHARQIVTCSDGMTARVLAKGVLSEKLTTVSNCCDAPSEARSAVRHREGVTDDQLVAIYTGALGRSNAVDDLAACIRLTSDDPRIVWWLAGDGAEASKVTGIGPRVRSLGKLPHAQVTDLLAGADVALVTFLHEPLFEENSPNKFFDAIAAGLPVVYNRSTWLEPWLERYQSGFVCRDPAPAAAMAQRLRELADDPDRRHRMATGARQLALEVFSRDALSDAYLNVLLRA